MSLRTIRTAAIAVAIASPALIFTPAMAQETSLAELKRSVQNLEARLEALEDRMRVLEESPPQQLSKSFTEQRRELDEALDLGEFAIRRFFDIIEDVEKEAEKRGMKEQ